MRVLVAMDKFKGTLTASEATAAVGRGVRGAGGEAVDFVLSDGGEGFVEAMLARGGGRRERWRVCGPLPEMNVEAEFGALADGVTGVVEMASAAGLGLVPLAERNPMGTTTFGVGQLIAHAARVGCRRIIVGLGGSATCDGGIGCAQGAGLTVLLRDGERAFDTEPLCGRDLERVLYVKHARGSAVDGVEIIAATDVTNPLCGVNGSARVFGAQKGATEEEVDWLDEELAALAQRTGNEEVARRAGAGAAGGLGFGLMAFFRASVRSGAELVMEAGGFDEQAKGVDLVITGEGRLDGGTLGGKAVVAVGRRCRRLGVRCVAVVGSVEGDVGVYRAEGIGEVISLSGGAAARGRAGELVEEVVEGILKREGWDVERGT